MISTETAIILAVLIAIFALLVAIARILSNHISKLYRSNSQMSGEAYKLRKDIEGLPEHVKAELKKEKNALVGEISKKLRETDRKTADAFNKFAVIDKRYKNQITALEKNQEKLIKKTEKEIKKLEGEVTKLKAAVGKVSRAKAKLRK